MRYFEMTEWMRISKRMLKEMKRMTYELPNGMKCNHRFLNECIRLGIINLDDLML